MPRFRVDFHVHTRASPDGLDMPERMVEAARDAGLHAIAITDHDRRGGYDRLVRLGLADPRGGAIDGFLIIPGIEVSTDEGHVLVLGAAWDAARGQSAAHTVRRAHASGAIAVAAHPFDRLRSGVGGRVLGRLGFDAVETCNSKSIERRSNGAALAFAADRGLPGLGGSDAHFAETVGRAHTLVAAESLSVRSVLEGVIAGRTEVVTGRHTAGEMARYWGRGLCTRGWVLDLASRRRCRRRVERLAC